MIESLLNSLVRWMYEIISNLIMLFFTSTSVPIAVFFSLSLLITVAVIALKWKFGAHKWFGKPILKFATYAVPFFFILSVLTAGIAQTGLIVTTDEQGAQTVLPGNYRITGVFDPSLGGVNIGLTSLKVMKGNNTSTWYLTRSSHWEDWQIDGVNTSMGSQVTVALIGRDLRLLNLQKSRPKKKKQSFFSFLSSKNSEAKKSNSKNSGN